MNDSPAARHTIINNELLLFSGRRFMNDFDKTVSLDVANMVFCKSDHCGTTIITHIISCVARYRRFNEEISIPPFLGRNG